MKYTHDAIVIGGGAAGLTAAGGCALFGLKVALIEGHKMGGECLNNGCVPSKALITSAKRAAEAREGKRHGVELAPPKVDWSGVHKHIHDAIAHIEPHDSQETFEEMGCEVIREWAKITGPHSVEVGGKTLTAPRIVIATGSGPAVPPIEGIDTVPYLTNENIFDLDALPGHLVIVGGGVIGMEMAQSFCRLGSKVTVINPGELMGRDDRDSVAVVADVMREEGVRFVTGKAAKVEGEEGAIRVHTGEGGEVIDGTHLLIAVGRKARVSGYGLEELGVELGRNGIKVDARRRTSVKSIYAIGDCREGPRLTHVSGYEGGNVALEIALGVPTKVDWKALPWCTYTEPEVAQIGMTETEAKEAYGDAVRVVKEGFDHNERAIAEDSVKGHLKVMFKGKKVVGASICGKGAGELLLPFSQMISGKASSFAMGSAIVSYPTRAEIVKASAFTAWEPTVFWRAAQEVGGFRAEDAARFLMESAAKPRAKSRNAPQGPSPFAVAAEALVAEKFADPLITAKGEKRASVALDKLDTLWFATGTLCNLACANCYIESSPTNDALIYLTAAEVERYLDEIAASGRATREIGFTGGEPFMNPQIIAMIELALSRGFAVLVLSNAMTPLRRHEEALLRLRGLYGDRLTIRVSIDHHTREVHEAERGANSWEPMLDGLRWLSANGFSLAAAGRSLAGEGQAEARAAYGALFADHGIGIDVQDPARLVLFPEMDAKADVPEISEGCWDILGKHPSEQMCATSRMVVHRKGEETARVVACTLLPYDAGFDLGETLAEAARDVPLNHPHCARFCVLGRGELFRLRTQNGLAG